jgi:hypothetical protein
VGILGGGETGAGEAGLITILLALGSGRNNVAGGNAVNVKSKADEEGSCIEDGLQCVFRGIF